MANRDFRASSRVAMVSEQASYCMENPMSCRCRDLCVHPLVATAFESRRESSRSALDDRHVGRLVSALSPTPAFTYWTALQCIALCCAVLCYSVRDLHPSQWCGMYSDGNLWLVRLFRSAPNSGSPRDVLVPGAISILILFLKAAGPCLLLTQTSHRQKEQTKLMAAGL